MNSEYYQAILLNIEYIKQLQLKKMFIYLFYEELYTAQTPSIIINNPILELKYLRFKLEYMQELSTANANIEEFNYFLSLSDQNEIYTYTKGIFYESNRNFN